MNEKQPIYVDQKNLRQFAFLKKLIDEEVGDYGSLDISISKHEGVIVLINHQIKFAVKGKKDFDNKS